MTIFELNDRVQGFDLQAELDSIIEGIEPEIIDLNTEQLYRGILSTGEEITPKYSPTTIEYKKANNDPYDRVTLKDTGDFYTGFFLEKNGKDWRIYSKDEKAERLAYDYSDEIFGLTDENISDVIEEFLSPRITQKLQSIL